MKQKAIITGASSGIGLAVAKQLAQAGYDLLLIARREEKLEELKNTLKANVEIVVLDVRNRKSVETTFTKLQEKWSDAEILINNAGLAVGLEPLQQGNIDDWDRMIDTNVKGLLYVSRSVLPWMVARNKGHIINIGSIAGKEAYPNGAVYCGSKFAVDAISKGMRMDTVSNNIKVTQICPGAVETEFSLVRFKGDENRAKNVYKGFAPLSPEDVANVIMFCISLPAHVNINDLVLMPTAQASATVFHKEL